MTAPPRSPPPAPISLGSPLARERPSILCTHNRKALSVVGTNCGRFRGEIVTELRCTCRRARTKRMTRRSHPPRPPPLARLPAPAVRVAAEVPTSQSGWTILYQHRQLLSNPHYWSRNAPECGVNETFVLHRVGRAVHRKER